MGSAMAELRYLCIVCSAVLLCAAVSIRSWTSIRESVGVGFNSHRVRPLNSSRLDYILGSFVTAHNNH